MARIPSEFVPLSVGNRPLSPFWQSAVEQILIADKRAVTEGRK